MRDLESRIRAVVRRRTPKGWRVSECVHPYDHGSAGKGGNVIRCLPVVDRDSLAFFLHEVGHVVCGHCDDPSVPGWLAEYEADTWAFAALRAEGIAVSERYRGLARHNVRCYIEKERGKDPDADIEDAALKFAYPDNWRAMRDGEPLRRAA